MALATWLHRARARVRVRVRLGLELGGTRKYGSGCSNKLQFLSTKKTVDAAAGELGREVADLRAPRSVCAAGRGIAQRHEWWWGGVRRRTVGCILASPSRRPTGKLRPSTRCVQRQLREFHAAVARWFRRVTESAPSPSRSLRRSRMAQPAGLTL